MSGAMAPVVATPWRETRSAFKGCLIASVTAVPSKPLWTMQSAHFS